MTQKKSEKEQTKLFRYDFNNIFSLETNIPYFEGMFHSFKKGSEYDIAEGEEKESSSSSSPSSRNFCFEFKLDPGLNISREGKARVNLMLFHNKEDDSVEFSYPWFRPICAKLERSSTKKEPKVKFSFNKNYLRFSNVVAEGWELIDIFRSELIQFLVQNGMYMFHGAAVKLGGEAVLLPAWGNTGKTSTSWMLAKHGGQFLTDEFAIIDREGNCYGLPCSSLVAKSTAERFGVELSTAQKAKLFWSDAKSKLLSSRFAPGGIKIYPDTLFDYCPKSQVNRLAIIENGGDFFERIGKHEAFLKIKAIQDYEFGWKSNPFLLARSFFSGLDLNSLAQRENSFIENFLEKLGDVRVVSSTSGSHYKFLLAGAPLVGVPG